MKVRKLSLFLCISLIFYTLVSFALSINADPVGSDEEVKSACGLDDAAIDRAKTYYVLLHGAGYSDAAVASILGNSVQESHINPAAEGDGGGGLFGFTPITGFANSSQNISCTHTKVSIYSNSVCGQGDCQIQYMLGQLDGAFKGYSGNITKYNAFCSAHASELSPAKYDGSTWSGSPMVVLSIPEMNSIESFKSIQDPVGGAAAFLLCYERAGGTWVPINHNGCGEPSKMHQRAQFGSKTYGDRTFWDFFIKEFDSGTGRVAYANSLYKWITGSEFSVSSRHMNSAGNIAQGMVTSGLWSEEELAAYKKVIETDFSRLLLNDRSDLNQNDISNLANWERNVHNNAADSGIIYYLRIAMMLMGIIIIIYSVLLYLAYWFDRVNTFFDLDLLGILTMGRLHMSDTEEECTFHMKDMANTEKKTVNHRAIVMICVLGVGFGTMIITGFVYKCLMSLVNFIMIATGQVK